MPTIVYVQPDGSRSEVLATAGTSVMKNAVQNDVPGIVAECGGSLSCATCHVFVDEQDLGQLPPMEDMEDEMLYGTTEDRRENSRLSCQLPVTEETDLHVTTPEMQV